MTSDNNGFSHEFPNPEGFEPTKEDLMEASVRLFGELEACRRAGAEVLEHATAYRRMLKQIHAALRQKENSGEELTKTEQQIRIIIGKPEDHINNPN